MTWLSGETGCSLRERGTLLSKTGSRTWLPQMEHQPSLTPQFSLLSVLLQTGVQIYGKEGKENSFVFIPISMAAVGKLLSSLECQK